MLLFSSEQGLNVGLGYKKNVPSVAGGGVVLHSTEKRMARQMERAIGQVIFPSPLIEFLFRRRRKEAGSVVTPASFAVVDESPARNYK